MSHIYRGASCVLVWLGKMDAKSALAFDIVEKSIRPSLEDFISHYAEKFDLRHRPMGDIKARLKEQFQDLKHRSYLCQLVSCMGCEFYDFEKNIPSVQEAIFHTFTSQGRYQWWKRLWVIQEVLYARHVRLVCGSRSIGLDDIPLVHEGLAYCTANARTRFGLIQLSSVLNLEKLRIESALFDHKEPKGTLDQNLISFHMRESSDLRDKIYSLLNVSCFKVAQMLPDYSKQLNEVFTEASRAIIAESGSLDMITCLKCKSDGSTRSMSSEGTSQLGSGFFNLA
jgi:hypothetical protein